MAEYSRIDYLLAQHDGEEPGGTWSPWIGCDKRDPDGTLREGCRHCWAEMWARRNPRFRGHWGRDAPRYFFGEEHWQQPLRWQRKCERLGRRKRVLVSLCDPFEQIERPVSSSCSIRRWPLATARARLWDTIGKTPAIDWLLLTRRPENIKALGPGDSLAQGPHRPLPNLWLGVSVWDQPSADRMIPLLLEVPAAVRWVSPEPLLGPLDVSRWLEPFKDLDPMLRKTPRIGWLVVGHESRGARPGRRCDPEWAQALREQCAAASVPMFTKQLELSTWPGRLVKSKELGAYGWPVQLPENRL